VAQRAATGEAPCLLARIGISFGVACRSSSFSRITVSSGVGLCMSLSPLSNAQTMRASREPSVMSSVKAAQVRHLRSVEDAVGLRVRLLGPMTITVEGRPVAIAARKARALLGYLALREGIKVGRGVLTGLLWGDRSEGQARASLRQTLSELKSALGEAASSSILATKEAVAWAQGSAWIDTRLVESAAGSEDDATLREAADLAGGELMEDPMGRWIAADALAEWRLPNHPLWRRPCRA